MNLNDAKKKCEHGSTLLNPKSDQEVNFFRNLFANEDFWISSDIEPLTQFKNVVCQVDLPGLL